MVAYVVITRTGPVHDEAEMAEYGRLAMAGPPVEVEPLALYGTLEALEGEAPDAIALLKFNSIEEARRWYHSEAYQKAAQHRHKAAPYTMTIVEGL